MEGSAMRWVLAVILMLVVASDASAQAGIPGRVFVKDSNGDVWYVGAAGSRAPVALYPASDDELAALPVLDGWFAARPNGTGVGFTVGPKPDYSNGQGATPVATVAPTSEETVKLDGDRAQNSKPFSLRGGTYAVTWEAKLRRDDSSCFGAARVYRVDGKRLVDQVFSVLLKRDGDRTANGETTFYGVAGGQHYLDVSGSCEWSVEIQPG